MNTRQLAKISTQQEEKSGTHTQRIRCIIFLYEGKHLRSLRVDKSPNPLQNQLSGCEFFMNGRQALHWKKDPDSRKAQRSGL